MRIRLKRKRLEGELKRSRLSQNGWARYLGISSSLLSMLLSGERRYPSAETRRKLMRGLRLPFDELFEEVAPAPRQVVVPAHLRVATEEVWMSAFWYDLRQAGRSLFKSGGFAAVTLALLAVGLGAAGAVAVVLNDVLLAPLPYEAPEELVAVWPDHFLSYREVLFLDDAAGEMEHVAAVSPGWGTVLTGAREPAQLTASRTTPGLFRLLGSRPLLGRTFAADEFTPGRHRVTLLSYAVWQRYFGGDPGVVGTVVQLDGEPHEIIGVMAADFELLALDDDLWTPLPEDASAWYWEASALLAVGRLADGSSLDRSRRELAAHVQQMQAAFSLPDDYGEDARVAPLHDVVVDSSRPVLQALGAGTALILLLVVTTVGTLVLARSLARRRELSIRMALGGSPGRVARQLLFENGLLCVAGAALALVVAGVAVRFLVALLAAMETARLAAVHAGWSLPASVVGLALLVWALTGASVLASRPFGQAAEALRGSRSTTGSARARVRGVLVTAQLALAAALVIGAGLMVRSVVNLYRVDPGLRVAGVQTFQVQASAEQFADTAAVSNFFIALRQRLEALPFVESVGLVQHLPMTSTTWSTPVDQIEGRPSDSGRTAPRVGWRIVDRAYFATLDVPLIKGRLFGPQDRAGSEPVVIVNQAMASALWGGADPVGSRVKAGNATRGDWARVVGVVGNVRYTGLDQPAPAALYRPHSQHVHRGMSAVVRTRGQARIPTAEIQRLVWELDPDVPVSRTLVMGEILNQSIAARRLTMMLLVALGAAGLLMGALGLYGLVSYLVDCRRREMGVRLALGARPGSVVALLMKEGIVRGVIGSAAGVGLALLLGRLLESLLFGVDRRDLLTLAAVPLLLVATAALASYLPARRTLAGEPMRSLHNDG